MKIKKGFILRTLGEQKLVVAVGDAGKKFRGMIRLNETSAFLWEQLKEEKSKKELVRALMESYEVSEEKACSGVESFLNLLKEVKCIDGAE